MNPIRVLLVEDDEGSRRGIERFLRVSGYEVTAVESAEDAEAALATDHFSIVVSDYKLPGKDGIELIRHIKEASPAIPCLLISAHGDIRSAVEAMKAGAFNFLEKPVSPEQLANFIEDACEKERLAIEVEQLRHQLNEKYGFENIIGSSPIMMEVFERIKLAAPTDTTVLITGESGTGKELVAKALHQNSPRRDGPFVAVNCSALPGNLVESELFGHEKGAFTGAATMRRGFFEAAKGGSLFVDEIGDMAPELQAKLLRALEQRVITRVGSTEEIAVDVRIIAATNQDLQEKMRNTEFREDLFFRLAVVRIGLPPLRDRKEDLPQIAAAFLAQLTTEHGREVSEISPEALDALQQYPWPGNVRELRNVLESMIVLNTHRKIDLADLPGNVLRGEEDAGEAGTPIEAHKDAPGGEPPEGSLRTLAEVEKQTILGALEACEGNRTRAAQLLGIGLSTIHRKLREYEQE